MIVRHRSRKVFLGLLCAAAVMGGVTGCSIDMPSRITDQRVQLEARNYSERYTTGQVTDAELANIAAQFSRYGSGELELIVGYDPYSKSNTAMRATDNLHRIKDGLAKRGVHNIKANILAVEHSGDTSEMMVGYRAYSAQAPADCTMMPGYENTRAMADFDYKLGCSLETMVSKQVAHPEDLAGRAVPTTPGDGARAAVVVTPYRAGEANGDLGGESSTGN